MTYFWLLLGYLVVRLILRYAFYEQGVSVGHFVRLFAEGFLFTAGMIVLIAMIGAST